MRLTIRDKYYRIQLKISTGHIGGESYANRERALDFDDYSRYVSFTIWESFIYLRRAFIFKRYFRPLDKENLIHFVDNLYQDIAVGKRDYDKELTDADKRHVLTIYNMISRIDTFNKKRERAIAIRDNLAYIRNGIRDYQNRNLP